MLGGPQEISRRGRRALYWKPGVVSGGNEAGNPAGPMPITIKPVEASLACNTRSPEKSVAADIGINKKSFSQLAALTEKEQNCSSERSTGEISCQNRLPPDVPS